MRLKKFRERVPRTTADQTTILCDGSLGCFDEHGALRRKEDWSFGLNWKPVVGQLHQLRNRMAGPADALEGGGVPGSVTGYVAERLEGRPSATKLARTVRELLSQVPPAVGTPLELCIRTHRYRIGKARLLAFERNILWQMGEDLKQKGGNEALEKPVSFEARLAAAAHVYDLRTGKYLGQTDRIAVALDPWQPSLFALLPEKLSEGDVVAAIGRLTQQR